MRTTPSSPVGLHRVTDPAGSALPQAARVVDPSPELWPDEVLIAVETLNLDAASFRQLSEKHGGDGEAVRAEVLDIVATRGKMQNPVTGSGGMLIGTVAEVGPESPLGLAVDDRVATLVSLSLTPLTITDGLARWDGRSERVPAAGTADIHHHQGEVGREVVGQAGGDRAAEEDRGALRGNPLRATVPAGQCVGDPQGRQRERDQGGHPVADRQPER